MTRNVLLIWIFSACSFTSLFSQGYEGREFMLAIAGGGPVEFYIYSEHSARVSFTIGKENTSATGFQNGYVRTMRTFPGRRNYMTIPGDAFHSTFYNNYVLNNGIHIVSDSLIQIFYVSSNGNSGAGATALLPVSSIPFSPEYFITTNANNYSYSKYIFTLNFYKRSSNFIIVGISDRSKIEIIPKGTTTIVNNNINRPLGITLYKGETYLFNSDDYELTGTIIRGKTPESKFAVYAGNLKTHSEVRNQYNELCDSTFDYAVEQMIPITCWGKSYSVLPIRNNPGGYYLKILAAADNTVVRINGNYHSTLKSGQWIVYNINKDSATKVTANKAVSVTQYTKSYGGCNLLPSPKVLSGNISQIQVAPDEQVTQKTTLSSFIRTPNFSETLKSPEYYYNAITKTNDTAFFKDNNKSIPNTQWIQDPNLPNYSFCRIQLDTFIHILTSNKGFIAYTYSHLYLMGYATIGGSELKPIQQNFNYDYLCKLETITFTPTDTNQYKNFKWKVDKSSSLKTGKQVSHTYYDTGWKKVIMYYNHKISNIIDSVEKHIYIDTGNRRPFLINDTLICGLFEMQIYSKYFETSSNYHWWDGHKNYYKGFNSGGLFWAEVTEKNGCTFRDSILLSNEPNPVSSFTMSDTLLCKNRNGKIMFVNNSTSQDSIVSHYWDFDNFNTVDTALDTMYSFYPNPGQYQISLKVSTKDGCFNISYGFVEILKAPEAKFDIVSLDSCFNSNSVSYVNRTIRDVDEHWRYKWYFSEGYIISNSNPSGLRTYDNPGKYSTNLIYEFHNGCIDTMTKWINIYKNPEPDFELSVSVPCNGDSVHFVNKTDYASKPYSFQWQFGDQSISTDSTPKHLFPNKGAYTVKLQVVSAESCTDSITKQIYISGTTVADFTINDTDQCINNNVFSISDLSYTDTGSITQRQWKFSDGTSVDDLVDYDKIFSQSGDHTISIRVANDFGCSDSLTKKIIVFKNPDGTISVNKSSQCEDVQDFDFNFVGDNTSNTSYFWVYGDDSSFSSSTLQDIQFPESGMQNIRVRVTGNNGCTYQTSRLVNVNPMPNAAFSVNSLEQCFKNQSFDFSNTSSIETGSIATTNWSLGDNTSSTNIDVSNKSYLLEGSYKVLLRTVSDSACVDTQSAVVFVNPNPEVNLVAIKPVCYGDTTRITSIINVGNGSISTYNWEFGDMNFSSQKEGKHVYGDIGDYQVRLMVTSDKNCSDTSSFVEAKVIGKPPVDFTYSFLDAGNDQTMIKFKNTSFESKKQFWDFDPFGSSISKDTNLLFNDSLTLHVRLRIVDKYGCSNTKEAYIFIGNSLNIFIPNVFTPNGDGHNDGFGPIGLEYAHEYVLIVYNRWGEIVFKSNDPNEQWDGTYQGKMCPNGVYIYRLELRDFYGRYNSADGSVLLKW